MKRIILLLLLFSPLFGTSQNIAQFGPIASSVKHAYVFQPEAKAYIEAVEGTGVTLHDSVKRAIDTLVRDLKGLSNPHYTTYNIWSRIQVIYPFVGGTSSAHSFNLKDTANYQITWFGSPTHNANGVKGNGSSAYGATGFNASGILTASDANITVYGQGFNEAAYSIEVGSFGGDAWGLDSRFLAEVKGADGTSNADAMNVYVGRVTSPADAMSQSKASYGLNRITGRSSLFIDGIEVVFSIENAGTTPNFQIGIFRPLGSISGGLNTWYSSRTLAFISIGNGLSVSENTGLDQSLKYFNTKIGR